jgi:hypothetical protein
MKDAGTTAAVADKPAKIVDRGPILPTTRAWFERRITEVPTLVGEEGVVEVVLCIDDSVEALTPKGYSPITLKNGESAVYPEQKEALLGTETFGGRSIRVYRIERRAFHAQAKGALTFEGPSARDLGGNPGSAPPPRTIEIKEAPAVGRPANFREGDVGLFTLSAETRPKQVHPGGVTRVTVTVDGFGNVPAALTLPVRDGVSFGAPQVRASTELRAEHLHQTRVFTWDVTVRDPGTTDLGEVTLPYWDPTLGRYAEARAALGTVAANASAAVEADEPDAAPALAHVTVREADAPFLNPDSPMTTAIGVTMLIGAVVAVVVGVRRPRPKKP